MHSFPLVTINFSNRGTGVSIWERLSIPSRPLLKCHGREKTSLLSKFLRETVNHSLMQSVFNSLPQAHLKCCVELQSQHSAFYLASLSPVIRHSSFHGQYTKWLKIKIQYSREILRNRDRGHRKDKEDSHYFHWLWKALGLPTYSLKKGITKIIKWITKSGLYNVKLAGRTSQTRPAIRLFLMRLCLWFPALRKGMVLSY